MTATIQKIKFITPREFREAGYLQELNRQFLHPLGLALAILIDEETGNESFGGIWDYRDDPEGIYFDYSNPEASPPDRVQAAREKMTRVNRELAARSPVRMKALGYIVEPIPE
jgi:hypothetical protein